MPIINVRLDEQARQDVRVLAARAGLSSRAWVAKLIERALWADAMGIGVVQLSTLTPRSKP